MANSLFYDGVDTVLNQETSASRLPFCGLLWGEKGCNVVVCVQYSATLGVSARRLPTFQPTQRTLSGWSNKQFGFLLRYYEKLGRHFVFLIYCMCIDNDFLPIRVFNIQRWNKLNGCRDVGDWKGQVNFAFTNFAPCAYFRESKTGGKKIFATNSRHLSDTYHCSPS